MDVGYLETEILIVFEDQPAISNVIRRVHCFDIGLLSRYAISSSSHVHHGIFNPVKNPIKSHKTRTATNRIMLAQCLTIRIKIQISNLRNGVFLTSWLTAFCSEFIIAARNVYGEC